MVRLAQPFSAKFEFVLKALSMSRGRLGAELGVDKSIVGRWARGVSKPSADNLARLTNLVAARVTGFTVLDWERDPAGLARILGADPETAPRARTWRLDERSHGELLDQILATTRRRGAAYQGFYLSTRPFATCPGRFIRDRMMIRHDENDLLRFDLRCGGVRVEGWVLPQDNQLFVVGAESASGSLAFGIFNGVSTARAAMIEGLLLSCALDAGRTPTACAMVFERVGELTGKASADDARFAELAAGEGLAAEGSVPEDLQAHLTRNIGPDQLAFGGDWLLRLPLTRSLSRGIPPP
jgi:transcriptional regulator with XRE-family HTH domain